MMTFLAYQFLPQGLVDYGKLKHVLKYLNQKLVALEYSFAELGVGRAGDDHVAKNLRFVLLTTFA